MVDVLKCGVTKLNSKNYFNWKFRMELVLRKQDIWSVVSTAKPNDLTAAQIIT
jgi:hypothetical protein